MRYRDGRRSICVSSQSGCPLTCTFCATGAMRFARNLTALGDRRPGAPLSPYRADRPLRVHGHGRADDEPRQRARRVRAPPRHRHHPPAHRRSRPWAGSPGSNGSPNRTCPCAWRCRCTPPTKRSRSQLMPVNERYPLTDVIEAARAFYAKQAPAGVRRVRDARRDQRPLRAGARAGQDAVGRTSSTDPDLQGQPDPLQPYRGGPLSRDRPANRSRAFRDAAARTRHTRDRPPHARARHRRRLRPARRTAA